MLYFKQHISVSLQIYPNMFLHSIKYCLQRNCPNLDINLCSTWQEHFPPAHPEAANLSNPQWKVLFYVNCWMSAKLNMYSYIHNNWDLRWQFSTFKELFECRANLLDHVWGGSGSAMLVECLTVTLSGQRTSSKRCHHGWIYTEGGQNRWIRKYTTIKILQISLIVKYCMARNDTSGFMF